MSTEDQYNEDEKCASHNEIDSANIFYTDYGKMIQVFKEKSEKLKKKFNYDVIFEIDDKIYYLDGNFFYDEKGGGKEVLFSKSNLKGLPVNDEDKILLAFGSSLKGRIFDESMNIKFMRFTENPLKNSRLP